MDTAKIAELVAELEADIKIRQEAIRGLAKLLSAAQPMQHIAPSDQLALKDSAGPMLLSPSDSYVDLAVKVITANDYNAVPMKELAKQIGVLKGNPNINRRSVESTLIRHIVTKGERSRLVKVGRGLWAVRRYPREAINF